MRCLLTPLLLTLTLALTGSPAAAAAPPSGAPDPAAIDGYVEDYLSANGLVGAGVAVVHDGEVVHTTGAGENDDAAATADTPFSTGSVGKLITSFAVLQLADEGLLDLDDPVVRHVPEFELSDGRQGDITVRHLLSHTSGIPNPTFIPPAHDLSGALENLRGMELTSGPGERHAYSNVNYHLAGRLVEAVTGTPLGDRLDAAVFTPLGMTDSRTIVTTRDDDPGAQNGHVTAYGAALPGPALDQLVAGPGGIVTTAEDMGRFTAMLTDAGRTPDGEQLLSTELLDEAQSPQPGSERYGLGWQLSAPDTEPVRIGHSGSTTRYSAQLHVAPESGYGVVVMLNSFTPTLEHPHAISSGILDLAENGRAEVGAPVATLIDLALGLLTLAALGLTVLGARRSGTWADRRAERPGWRFALRLTPHALAPALAIALFAVVPTVNGNSATPLDVLTVWPAAMVLLLTLAASGVVIIAARVRQRAGGLGLTTASDTPGPLPRFSRRPGPTAHR